MSVIINYKYFEKYIYYLHIINYQKNQFDFTAYQYQILINHIDIFLIYHYFKINLISIH